MSSNRSSKVFPQLSSSTVPVKTTTSVPLLSTTFKKSTLSTMVLPSSTGKPVVSLTISMTSTTTLLPTPTSLKPSLTIISSNVSDVQSALNTTVATNENDVPSPNRFVNRNRIVNIVLGVLAGLGGGAIVAAISLMCCQKVYMSFLNYFLDCIH
jgi:hypothetical protein